MINDITDMARLANDVHLPMLGFGTWKLKDGPETIEAVTSALKIGYRHIDTAAVYENEKGVGLAIRGSGIPREEIFLTTKAWNDDIRAGYDGVIKACDASLELLGLDYVDLYLLHWPIRDKHLEAWRAMESLLQEKKVRAIGVCNYCIEDFDALLAAATVRPMINQIEFHPWLTQPDLVAYCREHAIVVEAWSPLMQGKVGEVPEIVEIAARHGKSPAQVVLRWDLQHKIVTIPKSSRPERIAENADIFDFELSLEEMGIIDSLDRGRRFGADPANFDF